MPVVWIGKLKGQAFPEDLKIDELPAKRYGMGMLLQLHPNLKFSKLDSNEDEWPIPHTNNTYLIGSKVSFNRIRVLSTEYKG